MKRLTKVPANAKLIATRGEHQRLYKIDEKRGVLENRRSGLITEVLLMSAIAKGYWEPVK